MTWSGISGIPGEAAGGRFADHAGRRKAAGMGVLLMTAGLFLLVLCPGTWLLSVSMFIWGFGWAFNHAGVSTLLAGSFLLRRSFTAGVVVFGIALAVFVLLSGKLLKEKQKERELPLAV